MITTKKNIKMVVRVVDKSVKFRFKNLFESSLSRETSSMLGYGRGRLLLLTGFNLGATDKAKKMIWAFGR